MIKILRPVALAPITQAGEVPAILDASAVIFRNAGSATVNLWNGAYTLDSKETVSFNVCEEQSALVLQNIPVSFDSATGEVYKLQIIVIKSENC